MKMHKQQSKITEKPCDEGAGDRWALVRIVKPRPGGVTRPQAYLMLQTIILYIYTIAKLSASSEIPTQPSRYILIGFGAGTRRAYAYLFRENARIEAINPWTNEIKQLYSQYAYLREGIHCLRLCLYTLSFSASWYPSRLSCLWYIYELPNLLNIFPGHVLIYKLFSCLRVRGASIY